MTQEDILENSLGKGVMCEINEMNKYIDQLEKHNKSLLERIAELEEPLSCLGCKHDGRYEYCKTMECIRLFTLDNYEPEQN